MCPKGQKAVTGDEAKNKFWTIDRLIVIIPTALRLSKQGMNYLFFWVQEEVFLLYRIIKHKIHILALLTVHLYDN